MSGSWTKCCHAKHAKGGLQMCIRSQTRQHAATIYDGPCIDNKHKIKHVSSKLCSGPWGIFQKTGGKNKKERIFEIMLVSVRKNIEKTKCRFVIIIYYVNRTMMRGTTILPSFPYLNIWGIYTGLWTRISVNLSNQDQYAASKDHFKEVPYTIPRLHYQSTGLELTQGTEVNCYGYGTQMPAYPRISSVIFPIFNT